MKNLELIIQELKNGLNDRFYADPKGLENLNKFGLFEMVGNNIHEKKTKS